MHFDDGSKFLHLSLSADRMRFMVKEQSAPMQERGAKIAKIKELL